MKGQRGRKSAASLSIVPVTGIQRPEPPPELSAEESAVWTATTRAMKPDWFGPETHPILAAYCLHLVTANMVAQRLRTTTIDAPDFRQLAAMHRSETKTVLSILRLTPRGNRYAGDGRAGGRFHPARGNEL